MTKQYNNISVFKAKPSDNPKSPQYQVVLEMADGTKWRGGLWEATSKAGTRYLRGSLDPDTGEHSSKRSAPAKQPENNDIDW